MKSNFVKHKVFMTICIIILVIAALFIDSRFRFVSTVYDLSYDIPESFDGFRVVQISDLHLISYGKDNQRLLKAVRKQEPDIIVLTGDLINRVDISSDGRQSENLRPFLEALVQIAPCYFVSGNHEWASGEIQELAQVLDDIGVTYLRNEFVPLHSGSDSIVLAGVEDPNGYADMLLPNEVIDNVRMEFPDEFVLLLGHRNYWLDDYPLLDVDLILCGHAHGGVWRIPFVGGVFGTNLNLFPKNTEGVCSGERYDMLVSRGLGNNGFIPRFLNNPQLVTVVLHKK